MSYVDRLVNLAFNHSNKLPFLATIVLTIIMGTGDFPPDGVGG